MSTLTEFCKDAQKRSFQLFEVLSPETSIFRKIHSKIFYSFDFDFSVTTNDFLNEGGKVEYHEK